MSYKEHCKEKSPIETVNEIKQRLDQAGIEVEEHWMDVSEINTYTLRLTVKGTNIGTNGKGVTKEYAMASGYAEFMERLENDLLWGTQWFQNMHKYYDSKVFTTKELIQDNSSFIQYYFEKSNMVRSSLKKKIEYLEQMEILQEQISGERGRFVCLPFYNIGDEQVEYLPASIYPLYYGSNGMCAGNSREEALVQGMSEIVERYVQGKCFHENLVFPDFPEEEIQKYPYIYEMYKKIKAMDGMKVWMKDCSMGGKYPVAALITLHENTGRFGVKFGCHPVMSIAMERTLTEATQGQSVLHFSTSSAFDFTNDGVTERHNIENAMKVGIAQYPHQLFSKKPDFEYAPCKDYQGWSNKEILQDWCRSLMEDGWKILIRNASFLDFNAYHIIVPGISEIRDITQEFSRRFNTRLYASYLLKDLNRVNLTNLRQIIGAVESTMMSINENRLATLFSSERAQELPASELQEENSLFCCYAYFMLGEYAKALGYISCIINKAMEKEDKNIAYYVAVKNYITGYAIYKNHGVVIEYMKNLFAEDVVEKIDNTFAEKDRIIQKIYAEYQVSETDTGSNDKKEMNDRLIKLRNEKGIEQEKLRDILSA